MKFSLKNLGMSRSKVLYWQIFPILSYESYCEYYYLSHDDTIIYDFFISIWGKNPYLVLYAVGLENYSATKKMKLFVFEMNRSLLFLRMTEILGKHSSIRNGTWNEERHFICVEEQFRMVIPPHEFDFMIV